MSYILSFVIGFFISLVILVTGMKLLGNHISSMCRIAIDIDHQNRE